MKTDHQIQKDVTEELDWDPAIDAASIGVEVHEGIVTLDGHLSSYAEKLAAERAAERISGVRAVVVKLDVHPPGAFLDEAIAEAARGALQWHVHVPSDVIKVRVERGWVTLSGNVDWGYQKKLAERTVSQLRGVIGVVNNIRMNEKTAPPDVEKRIEEALLRHAVREAHHISVKVKNGTATLSGHVDSLADRRAAIGAVWSAPGISAVIDQLETRP
ncbi:BON domain-containing protein [Cupriavidus necator]|uniref:BON domain-containing protein n=1 Tax=Cupriavidus necator (strain ATCC 17699 / DSM 428 / KCTC 22496 / NCIMB 10442 / H16 / Stanier 337) TaxID=381666 RepID=Q0KA55_CUPNH|nr:MULTISPECIES: BON domain-containing protein [Cupriavidus]EON20809.1 lipoprotein [Cupriavidus sp. GA3-3]KUE86980.1 OsmY domain-containing protein [Cupriavidus necator]QCC00946.1 BON domain-containing protein [Cupriavidus necator H16]QQB76227.1 BON domain-containing protein [Cupriavidus necator]WKA39315.1 BON domain-containing protein [Cupriavidus necator]